VLTNLVYDFTLLPSFDSDRNLRHQMRTAAVSVMANIAEGFDRQGAKEFAHFLSTAKGSCTEVRSHLYVALDRNYIERSQFEEAYNLSTEIGVKIFRLQDSLRNRSPRQ
jgi:four helix bundle protein